MRQFSITGTEEPLIEHLHNFVSEVKLTDDEFLKAIDFLNAVGKKDEFFILSGTLGVGKLVSTINYPKLEGITESNSTGPFYRKEAPLLTPPAKIYSGEEGEVLLFSGNVMTPDGKPIVGALLDIWQAAPNGLYEDYDDKQPDYNFRGLISTDKQGRYQFQTLKPGNYKVSIDGPVEQMLQIMGRHAWRPAHIHFKVWADGYEPLTTQISFKDDPYLESDAVFVVKPSLVININKHDSPEDAAQHHVNSPFYSGHYDFILKPVV